MSEEKNNHDHIDDDEDIVFNKESDGEETADAQDKIRKLKQKIKTLKKEKRSYLEELQRSKAEFLNARKRDEEYKREEIANANEHLIQELLPVIDSFEMAFADKKAYESTPENWRKGVDYIYSQLLSILEANGVKQIDPINEQFDPTYHEAIDQVAVEDNGEDNSVVEVVQKGYQLNDKVIRSAKVKVGSYRKDASDG